ncbi:putative signal transduction histidine kinase, phosphotransfer (Hpt) domain, HPT domain superfamily [Dioscorea sansibarensis]
MASLLELKKSLADLKFSLTQESILGRQFERLYIAGRGAARELLSVYCSETEKLLNELTMNLNLEAVNYHKLYACVHRRKSGSSSIGATRMVYTCMVFSDHCKAVNNEGVICIFSTSKMSFKF